MSVVKSKQEQGELTVVTRAADLAAYTVHICTNEKNFPKRYRWCVTSKIVEDAVDIDRYINAANSVKVERTEDYQMRRTYQKRALALTYSLILDNSRSYRLWDRR